MVIVGEIIVFLPNSNSTEGRKRREEMNKIHVYMHFKRHWLLLNTIFDKQIGTKKRHVRRKVSLFKSSIDSGGGGLGCLNKCH